MERALTVVANPRTPTVLVGPLAAALLGSPQRPRDGVAEIVAADREQALRELAEASARSGGSQESAVSAVSAVGVESLDGLAPVFADELLDIRGVHDRAGDLSLIRSKPDQGADPGGP